MTLLILFFFSPNNYLYLIKKKKKTNIENKLAIYLFFLLSGSWQEKLVFVAGILIHRFHLQLRSSV